MISDLFIVLFIISGYWFIYYGVVNRFTKEKFMYLFLSIILFSFLFVIITLLDNVILYFLLYVIFIFVLYNIATDFKIIIRVKEIINSIKYNFEKDKFIDYYLLSEFKKRLNTLLFLIRFLIYRFFLVNEIILIVVIFIFNLILFLYIFG